jgi:hypothetical protein
MAVALRAAGRLLGDAAAGQAADRALETVRSRFDGERWGDQFELLGGNAGIALGALAAGDPGLALLAVTPYHRCWHTVTRSGVPRRIRPGFWDNSGRCCGTAGVLALACDRHAESGGDLAFATLLASDLAARATVDEAGVRWSNVEHRVTPSALEPRTGWAMGNAGIIRELLRFARVTGGADPSYAVTWPDHPPAGCLPGP